LYASASMQAIAQHMPDRDLLSLTSFTLQVQL
jgi:hypothetical protein